jgi:hypothetical protein
MNLKTAVPTRKITDGQETAGLRSGAKWSRQAPAAVAALLAFLLYSDAPALGAAESASEGLSQSGGTNQKAGAVFGFPGTDLRVAQRAVLLSIDDVLLPLKKNLCYYMQKPVVRLDPVLTPSRDNPRAPDYTATHFYGTVLQDGDRFRMWYYAISPAEKPGDLREGPICYAESEDGLRWTKPRLGQVEFNGSRDNNAVALPGRLTEGTYVLKDAADPDPARRYKMAYQEIQPHNRFYSLRTATSPDGLHWVAGPVSPVDEGLEPCAFYKFNEAYIVNAHFAPFGVSEGGHRAGRQGHAWLSYDFNHWLPESVTSFTLPEPPQGKDRGLDKPYDQVHLGTAAYSYGNVMVGLYCVWHARPKAGDWFGEETTSGDFGVVISHDGLRFHEPVKGYVLLAGKDSPAAAVPGKSLPTILCQANGILNVGDETRIYHGRWRNGVVAGGDYYAEVGLATLPRDRWGALGLFPGKAEGTAWSAPVKLPQGQCELRINAEDAAGVALEIANEGFELLPSFSGASRGTAGGTAGLELPVNWPGGSLNELAGRTVRLRICLHGGEKVIPRLYAVYLLAPARES